MNYDIDHMSAEIESLKFCVFVNQAAGLSAFKQIVADQEVFQALLKLLKSDTTIANQLVKKVQSLSLLAIDDRYEHPYDTAISVYLLALDVAGLRQALNAARLLISVQQLWWSEKLSRQIISRFRHFSSAADYSKTIKAKTEYICLSNQTKTFDVIIWRNIQQTVSPNYAIATEGYAEISKIELKYRFPKPYKLSKDVQDNLFGYSQHLAFPATEQVGDMLECKDFSKESEPAI